jgi:RimJ/RimL family protein N-acetyltransferase
VSVADRGRSLLGKVAAGLVWSVQQYLYERSLETPPPPQQPPLPKGATHELVDRENVEWVREWLGAGEVRRFHRLLNRGDIGVYVLVDGQVVHYGWAALKLPGQTLAHAHDPIEVGDALLHRGYTREEYRGRGLGTCAIAWLVQLLRERYRSRGLRRVCALVRADNPAPQHLFARLGFQKKQQLNMVRLLGTCFIYRGHELAPDGTAGSSSPATVRVRFKVPEILWDPRLPILHAGRR